MNLNQVLVVDDSPDGRFLLGDALLAAGFDVATAARPQASGMIDALRPACVVVAADLSAVAIRTVRDVRSQAPRSGLVIVAENGYADIVEEQVSGLDVWAVVPRAAKPECLVEKVRHAIELASISPERQRAFESEISAEVAHFRQAKRETREFRKGK